MNSPYLSFGVESENQDLFKTINGKPANTSTGVSEWNLLSLVQLLTTGETAGGGIGDGGPGESSGGLGVIRELSDEEGEEGEVSNPQPVLRPFGSCHRLYVVIICMKESYIAAAVSVHRLLTYV